MGDYCNIMGDAYFNDRSGHIDEADDEFYQLSDGNS